MAVKASGVMSTNIITASPTATVAEVARRMADANIGDVLVEADGRLVGIVTDRDLVVRVLAEGAPPDDTPISSVCTRVVATASPDDDIDAIVTTMRSGSLRRIPVVENGRAIGILTLGDLAIARDPDSALAEISAAPANS